MSRFDEICLFFPSPVGSFLIYQPVKITCLTLLTMSRAEHT